MVMLKLDKLYKNIWWEAWICVSNVIHCLFYFNIRFSWKEWGPFCEFVADYIFDYIFVVDIYRYFISIGMQIFIDIEYLLCAQIFSFHLLSVNSHRKGTVSCKTVNPYNLNYINAIDFHWVRTITWGILVLSPTLIYYLKCRDYGMFFLCTPSKEMEPCMWRHNTSFNWFVVRGKKKISNYF